MESKRKRSKRGFFSFFDWHMKSTKKKPLSGSKILFALKHGKENMEKTMPISSQSDKATIDGESMDPSAKVIHNPTHASTVNGEEENRTRSPGVVAKLMGLDCLPIGNHPKPSSSSSSSSSSCLSPYRPPLEYCDGAPGFWKEYNKEKKHVLDSVESASSKALIRSPIHKFQTEKLPTKPRKMLSNLQYKLLSPVQDLGYILTKDHAFTRKTPLRMLEVKPTGISSYKLALLSSFSAPMKHCDLNQKAESFHKVVKHKKKSQLSAGKSMKDEWYGNGGESDAEDISPCKHASFSEKRKPCQRRGEHDDAMSDKLCQSRHEMQSAVAKQNREAKAKNGSVSQKASLAASKNLSSDHHGKRAQAKSDSFWRRRKTEIAVNSEAESGKLGMVVTGAERDKAKNVSRARRKRTAPHSTVADKKEDGVGADVLPSKCMVASFPEFIVGDESLGAFLERKIEELSDGLASSPDCGATIVEETCDSSTCSSQNSLPMPDEKKVDEHQSPVSVLEASFVGAGCSLANGSRGTHSVFPASSSMGEVLPASQHNMQSHYSGTDGKLALPGNMEADMEMEPAGRNCDLDYVSDILNNADLMLTDFALGRAPRVIVPNLFYQLENQHHRMEGSGDVHGKIWRRVLFDYVSESLDSMLGKISIGSFREWARSCNLFLSKGWLAEELCKGIVGSPATAGGPFLVDELVEKDMNAQHGDWLGFDAEAFKQCVEIEKAILHSLVDELVSDFILLPDFL